MDLNAATSLDVTARERASSQCARILGRLQAGRVNNSELARHFSLKYTGRISDLRKRNHDVRVVERNRRTGLTVYALFVGGNEQPSWSLRP